jgi:hypothetical protein
MNYIQSNESRLVISDTYLSQITTDDLIKNFSENIAIAEASSILEQRFDVDWMFRPVYQLSQTQTYLLNDRVNSSQSIYICITASATASGINNTTLFQKKDDRNPQLTLAICDIWIYHLLTSMSPQSVEENRKVRYRGAISLLGEWASGKKTLTGAKYLPYNQGNIVIWGSGSGTQFGMYELSLSDRKDIYGTDSIYPSTQTNTKPL